METINKIGVLMCTIILSLGASAQIQKVDSLQIATGAAAGKVLTSDANGIAIWSDSLSIPSDNLGNHIATQNIDLDTFKLVGNGGTDGILVANNGQITIENAPGAIMANDSIVMISANGEVKEISLQRFFGNGDSDGDGIPDWQELQNGSEMGNPNSPTPNGATDNDGDGIPNGLETLNGWSDTDCDNPTTGGCNDTDGDGIPNGIETLNNWDDTDCDNPTTNGCADDDGDGIPNGQEEINGWGSSDCNSPYPNGCGDDDGDGIPNGQEIDNGWGTNDCNSPTVGGCADADGDGIPNGLETLEGWDDNDPNNPTAGGNNDTDGDGIPNGAETLNNWDDNDCDNPTTNGCADDDGDGIPNGGEVVDGTDPNDVNDPGVAGATGAVAFQYDCGTGVAIGECLGMANNSGTITIPITNPIAGQTYSINVSDSDPNFVLAGSASGFITGSETSISIPYTYNGGGTAGTYTLTLTSAAAFGTCNTTVQLVPVVTSATGEVWMDRNLGASQVATSVTDHLAYGSLYQWGRAADGHELINRTSSTVGTPVNGTTATLSNSDTAPNDLFILSSGNVADWRSPQNNNLWQGVNGTNNPCPAGFRIPTETELNNERLTFTPQNASGAFASPLKLTFGGYRGITSGLVQGSGTRGLYWSSTPSSLYSKYLNFTSSAATINDNAGRANAMSVRCIKD